VAILSDLMQPTVILRIQISAKSIKDNSTQLNSTSINGRR